MPSPFTFSKSQDSSPASGAVVVTPSDTVDLLLPCRSLYVGATGNVVVDMNDGPTITFANAQAGSVLPLMVKRVRNTGTTAANIVALY